MSRALLVWKLKLCLAAAAVLLASAIAPQRPDQEQQQAKEKNSNMQMAGKHSPKVAAPAEARQPQKTDSGERLSLL